MFGNLDTWEYNYFYVYFDYESNKIHGNMLIFLVYSYKFYENYLFFSKYLLVCKHNIKSFFNLPPNK